MHVLNLNTNMMLESHPEAKNHLIFSAILILQQKFKRVLNMGSWG